MAVKQAKGLQQEIEALRKELYISANSHSYLLTSQDIYQASIKLDKVIVKYLKERYCVNAT